MKYFALAAAGMLLAACSSDSVEAGGQNSNEGEGAKYIAVGINLPTVPVTRAGDKSDNGGNVSLEDGLTSEYEVNDVTLLIFGADGKFKEVYDLSTQWSENDNDPHVTKTSGKVIQKVGGTVAVNDQLLVVINKNGLMTVENNALKINGEGFTGTFGDFQKTIVETNKLYAPNMTGNGFYMANAPLVDKQGSTTVSLEGANVRTLVPISSVYKTFDEAKSATSVDQIYVERGMAKVTLSQGSGNLSGDGVSELKYSVVGWTLDNTNTKSFLVRSTEKHGDFVKLNSELNGLYRYAGNTAITAGAPTDYKYRSYFAVDPNYDKDASAELTRAAAGDYKSGLGNDNPQYCYENTFNVDHQNENQTTLARVKVQVTDGETVADLYTVNGVKSKVYKEDGLKTLIQTTAYNLITPKPSEASTNIIVGLTRGDNGIVDFTLSGMEGLPEASKVKEALGEIVCYKDGISYYTIRIKHFGSGDGTDACLTPWNTTEANKPAIGNIYPTANRDNNYLGRYGVLRNNWYDLSVTAIKYLGDAEPKDPTTNTDDEIDAYIAFQIHVLSWAKRTQSWEF